jgi:hypothetical protein
VAATHRSHERPPDRVEDHPAIDVNVLARKGFLEPGTRTWHGDDGEWEPVGLTIVTRGDLLEFRRGGPRISAAVITTTPCYFGGGRPWFLCPGCERRCGKLHFAPHLPHCRDCADLRYESQLENQLERGLRRARRIRRQLGGEAINLGRFPDKPRGMRWATYGALREEALAAERAWLEAQQRDVARMLERSGVVDLSPAASAFVQEWRQPRRREATR